MAQTKNMTTGTGLKKETSAALVTLLGFTFIVPVLFILLEKDEFVRFWAFQSIIVYLALYVLRWIFILSIVLLPLAGFVFLTAVVLWLVMTYKAWQGEKWVVPIVGKFAVQLMKKA